MVYSEFWFLFVPAMSSSSFFNEFSRFRSLFILVGVFGCRVFGTLYIYYIRVKLIASPPQQQTLPSEQY